MALTRQPQQEILSQPPSPITPNFCPIMPTIGPTIGPAIGPWGGVNPALVAASQNTTGNAAANNSAGTGGIGPMIENFANGGNVATTLPSQLLQGATGQAAPFLGYFDTNWGMMSRGLGAVNNAPTRNLGALGAGFGLMQAPLQAMKLLDGNASTSDKLGAASNLTGTAKGMLETGGMFADYSKAKGAAMTSLLGAAPNAGKGVLGAGAGTAADIALGAMQGNKHTVVDALKGAAKGGGTLAEGLGVSSRAAAKGLLPGMGKGALGAAKGAGASTLGKMAGRFAPGMNIAIAGLDTANFISTLQDDKASTGKKVTSGITALGSIAAATNIPVVSQIGAGVSALSGLIGGFL